MVFKQHPDRKHNEAIQALIDKGYRFAIINTQSQILSCRRFKIDAERDSKTLNKVKVVELTSLMKDL